MLQPQLLADGQHGPVIWKAVTRPPSAPPKRGRLIHRKDVPRQTRVGFCRSAVFLPLLTAPRCGAIPSGAPQQAPRELGSGWETFRATALASPGADLSR